MFRKQEYQDPSIDYPIDDLNLKFSDYIAQCKQIISDHRPNTTLNRDTIIKSNSPFELVPTKTQTKQYGVLLIHGLFDSPFVTRDIAEILHSQGLLVRSILLPGHGTIPGAMLNVTYEDWLQTVRYGIETFKKEVDQLFILGYSIGSALAIYETLQSPSDFIAGIISLSPALKIKSKFAFLSEWDRYLYPINDRLRWLRITEEIDYARYLSIPFNAVYQCYELIKKINDTYRKKSLSLPQFFAVTLDDKTVSAQASLDYFYYHQNPANKLILYTQPSFQSPDARMIIRNAAYPDENILDISHIAIPTSPNNKHYGKNGDFLLASREGEPYFYDEIISIEEPFYDILFKLKLTRYPRRRLTYNPDFNFLAKEILKFIDAF